MPAQFEELQAGIASGYVPCVRGIRGARHTMSRGFDVKYCVHGGTLITKTWKDSNGKIHRHVRTYFSPEDVAKFYGLKSGEWVAFNGTREHENLIQLKPDPKQQWVLPGQTVGTPAQSHRTSKDADRVRTFFRDGNGKDRHRN